MKHLLVVLAMLLLSIFAFSQSKEKVVNAEKPGIVSIEGKSFGAEELNGKVVVLNFWYTSCPPCLKEIPELNELVGEYIGKDVIFIAFAVDNKAAIVDFLAEHPFKYDIIPSATQLMLRFLEPDKNGRLETAFPTHIVVDREGKKVVYETGIKGIEVVRTELKKQFASNEPQKG